MLGSGVRVSYAPPSKTLDLSRVFPCFGAFSTIVSTIIEFQAAFDSATRTCSKAVFLCFRYSVLADQLFQTVGSLLLHVLVAVTINVQGEGDCRMAQRFGQGLGIDVALQGKRRVGVPLWYNRKKRGSPYFTRGCAVCRCEISPFPALKWQREICPGQEGCYANTKKQAKSGTKWSPK